MISKPSSKKAIIVTVIFAIVIILGIVLSVAMGVNTAQAKVRNAVVTFEGEVNSSTLTTALEEKLSGNVVLYQLETDKEEDTTGTDDTTTTTAAGTFNSGKMLATVTGCDDKSADDIKNAFSEVFSGEDYKENALSVESISDASSINAFSWKQVYMCVIVLIVVFVYCLIRFHAIGALAAAVPVVISSALAAAVAVCASLICGVFVGSNISIVAAITIALTAVFGNIVLENVYAESEDDTCVVTGTGSIIFFALLLITIVGLISGKSVILGYSLPGLFAIVAGVVSSLAYVRCIWNSMTPKATSTKKTKSKAVIK